MQFIQNAALRLITGCHKASNISHLHAEAKLLPVAEHLSMLCAQFLASCMRSFHPSHDIVRIPPGPRTNKYGRPLKETLLSRFGDKVPHICKMGSCWTLTTRRPRMCYTPLQLLTILSLPTPTLSLRSGSHLLILQKVLSRVPTRQRCASYAPNAVQV
jgi:hypothetical protein